MRGKAFYIKNSGTLFSPLLLRHSLLLLLGLFYSLHQFTFLRRLFPARFHLRMQFFIINDIMHDNKLNNKGDQV